VAAGDRRGHRGRGGGVSVFAAFPG
jgi:hypothetical protein